MNVMDYDTADMLPGEPSAVLVRASADAGPTGAVLAYEDDGIWQYVAERDEHQYRCAGLELRTVYVEK